MNTRKTNVRRSEQGIAVIVAVALAVALIMITTALLGTTRRHTDTARAYHIQDILSIAAQSAKAYAIDEINQTAE
ncbi:hypothetical protein FACS1894139_15660 [Planctomycetales bacterium]|nr:hypothetical protein FACS1894108_11570 [Planctomycetales bacterium]GHT07393.1 hypothetical protein FACS1894139_15660 [Planctomycetales bacterium]